MLTSMIFLDCPNFFIFKLSTAYILKSMILNENNRYKYILENLLYFSDINEQNINICKLLLDPYNQYELNYHT
jgi:hypothetical protein